MKKLALLSTFLVLLIISGCKQQASQEEVVTTQDTTFVEKETDTLSTSEKSIKEEVKEEISEEVKEPIIVKKTPEPKIVKEVTKTNAEVKKEVIKEAVVTKEVVIEKEVEKPIEVKKEAEVVVEKVKEVVNTSGWIVPAKDKIVKNPTANSKENSAIGKELYSLHCKSCHGSKGLGDGPKAKSMKGDLGDFSSSTFQSQTDGELFYKIKVGRADMPSYAKKLSDEDIWLTIHYLRTLKK